MTNSSQENPQQIKRPIKVLYSALDNYGGYPFGDMFDVVLPVYNKEDLKFKDGALILWGGGDISPSIYGTKPCRYTNADEKLSSRDQLELQLAGEAIRQHIPIIGICRGAQLLCALAGGKLVQHVTDHTNNHDIKTRDGRTMKSTSLHHQMMYPFDRPHEMIAWVDPPISKTYLGPQVDKDNDEIIVFPEGVHREPEIVYFPEVKGLAIQGHPEFIQNEKHEFIQYCKSLVKEYVLHD